MILFNMFNVVQNFNSSKIFNLRLIAFHSNKFATMKEQLLKFDVN